MTLIKRPSQMGGMKDYKHRYIDALIYLTKRIIVLSLARQGSAFEGCVSAFSNKQENAQ